MGFNNWFLGKPKNAQELYQKGSILSKINKHEDALRCYEEAISLDPNLHKELWNNYGFTLTDLKRYREALTAFERAIAMDSKYGNSWLGKGRALIFLENYKEAFFALDEGLNADRLDDDTTMKLWGVKGCAYRTCRDYDSSSFCLRKALESGNDPDLWYELGQVQIKLKKYEDAIISFDNAIHFAPKIPDYWVYKGCAYYYMQNYEEAIRCFDRCINMNASIANSYYYKGVCLYKMGKFKQALSSFNTVKTNHSIEFMKASLSIDEEFNFARLWYYRGLTLKELGRKIESNQAFKNSLEVDPNFELARICLNSL